MSLALSKVANVNDFESEDFKYIYEKYQLSYIKPDVPISLPLLNRKTWEIAMALLSLDKTGKINALSDILGIGVAKEETITILSNYVNRVFATDIYLEPGTWGEWYDSTILVRPETHFDDRFNKRRVVMQHVDGTDLPYEDNSFDGIFSCSSIEHFGDENAIRKAIEEAHRVLKPGGVAAISTEYKVAGDGEGFHNVQLFDKDRLDRVWLDGIDWKPVDYIDLNVCQTEPLNFEKTIVDRKYAVSSPHMVLQNSNYTWTSVHLTLVKNG